MGELSPLVVCARYAMKKCLLALSALFSFITYDALGDESHLRGFEVMIRPSYGGAYSDSPVRYESSPLVKVYADLGSLLKGTESPYGSGFVGQAFIGQRFHPLVGGGLRGGFRTVSAPSTLADGSTDLERSAWDAGFYARIYPVALFPKIRKHIDPWIGLSVEYMRDMQWLRRTVATSAGTTVNADFMYDHHAVAVPIGLGVDYRVHPMISIGPSFEYSIVSAIDACVRETAAGYKTIKYCTNESPGSEIIRANSYGVWSIGIDLRFTL